MDAIVVIQHALAGARLNSPVIATRDLSGGCIHRVTLVTLADGRTCVAKVNREACLAMFAEEAASLQALAATKTVYVPQPLYVVAHHGAAALLMTTVEVDATSPSTSAWRRFGEDLAALHAYDAGRRYGFESDNHIGLTLQLNSWSDDWVEFNAVNRLGFQLQSAQDSGALARDEAAAVQEVIDRLDRLIPRRPKPALLHGDLWSGNALAARGDRIAVIDPACSIGDGWADIAMMRLFGGFPKSCMDSYAAAVADCEQVDSRVGVYQLYHLLNHVNLFGKGYAGQAVELARQLCR